MIKRCSRRDCGNLGQNPADVFEPSIDRFGGSIGRAGPDEAGKEIGGAPFESPSETVGLGQYARNAVADCFNQLVHQLATGGTVRLGLLIANSQQLPCCTSSSSSAARSLALRKRL